MSEWDITQLEVTGPGAHRRIPLNADQRTRVHAYAQLLHEAERSAVPNPKFSEYFVRESIGVPGGQAIPAGNIEYGLCQALHSEESAVAAFRAARQRGVEREKPIVAFMTLGGPGNEPGPINCCGNCRDILLDEFGPDLEMIQGTYGGGQAVVSYLRDILFDRYQDISADNEARQCAHAVDDINLPWVLEAIRVIGERLTNDAYSPAHIHPERRYAAFMRCSRAHYFGARDIMCDYHPIYPLRDAVREAYRNEDHCIKHVVVACEDYGSGPPHVMYKDRQHLLEFHLQGELLAGGEWDPPVYLAAYRAEQMTGLWRTSIKEWLPFPFSPRNFGDEFIKMLAEYYKRKRR